MMQKKGIFGAKAPMQKQERGGFFSKDGFAPVLLAGVSDFVDRRQGREPTALAGLAQAKMLEMQAAQEAQAAKLQRAQEMADWQYKEDYKNANMVSPIQRNAEYIEMTEGPEAASRYRQNYGSQMVQPGVVHIPNLGTFFGTPEQIERQVQAARGTPNVPQKPVGRLTPMGQANTSPNAGRVLSEEQYKALAAEIGEGAAQAYLQKHGMRVGK